MNSHRKTAILVGTFFILSTLTGVLSVFVYGDLLETSDYLIRFAENQNRIVFGSILELMCAGAFVLVSINAFPVLSLFSRRIAIGYVVGRSFEAVPFIISVISLLSLVTLSQEYVLAESTDNAIFMASGSVLQAIGHWANMYGPLVFCGIAALPFYYLLVRTELIPRWISVWGLIATVFYLTAGVLSLFGFDTTSSIAIMMIVPFAINEMVMAVWLIVKGFNSSTIVIQHSRKWKK